MQNTLPYAQRAAVSSPSSRGRKHVLHKFNNTSINIPIVKEESEKVTNRKPSQDSDAKLIEMINSVIVDRSPSVKWEDVGNKLQLISLLPFPSFPVHSFSFFPSLVLTRSWVAYLHNFLQRVLKRRSKLF